MLLLRDLSTLLRFPDFRRLLLVRLLSQLADGVYQVALASYVVFSPEEQTSAAAIASAMAVLLLPYSLLGPFAGVLLDRWQRRQVLLHGNLLRAGLALGTAELVLLTPPTWLFYLSALSVTAVNRFVLAGLSAALPRVVDAERLVMANSLSPTAGTVAATAGGGLALGVQLLAPTGKASPALVVSVAALLYLLSAAASLRIARGQLGPTPQPVKPRVLATLAGTARGLVSGLRHLCERRVANRVLLAVGVMRFCYGALTVMVLMLCRYAWDDHGAQAAPRTGVALLGLAVGLSGFGFFVAAVLTPWMVRRLDRLPWFAWCAAAAAVLVPGLGLTFAPVPILVAAFILGLATQSTKICADSLVQSAVDDAFRGRVFSLYDMLFNVAFVAAAATAALLLPPDGRSVALLLIVAVLYAATAVTVRRLHHATREVDVPPVAHHPQG